MTTREAALGARHGGEGVLQQPLPSLRDALRKHVVEPWFPRCVDRHRGGYNSDFDRRWRLTGPQLRLLEFQARQMRSAARLAEAFPQDERFPEIALHGLRYLRDVMWDHDHGGWYALVSADGAPLQGGTKHSHGAAYAIQACALVYQLTGEPDALSLAEEAFEWFDSRAHDDVNGGYFSWLTREGQLIRTVADVPAGADSVDPVAHGIGLKDINVLGDWLESLTEVVPILDSPLAAPRLQELADLFLDRLTTSSGDVYYAFHDDFMPLPQPERFGYAFQAVERLSNASHHVRDGSRLRERALAIGGHALTHAARGRTGGFMFFRAVEAPARLEGASTRGTCRLWWVQLAALQALAILATSDHMDTGSLAEQFVSHWGWLQRAMIDPVYVGFYSTAPDDLPRRSRPRGPFGNSPMLAKGGIWKDASHETDTLLGVLKTLGDESPIG